MDDRAIHIDTINGDFCLNKYVYIADSRPAPDTGAQVVCDQPCEAQEVKERDENLTFLLHPAIVDEGEQWRIHDEIKRLVKSQGVQEICSYLSQMRMDNKILLPQSPNKAYEELVRLGMPNGEGFNEITFRKYYNKK